MIGVVAATQGSGIGSGLMDIASSGALPAPLLIVLSSSSGPLVAALHTGHGSVATTNQLRYLQSVCDIIT